MRIQKVLTDNGKRFTNQVFCRLQLGRSGAREFDRLCAAVGIEHRLIAPRSLRTNGVVARFNGRLAEIIARHHFRITEDLQTPLNRFV